MFFNRASTFARITVKREILRLDVFVVKQTGVCCGSHYYEV